MASSKEVYTSNLLQDIMQKFDDCLKNSGDTRFLFDKVSKTLRESCQLRENYNAYDYEKSNKDSGADGLEPLESILLEKLQENSRLKMLNENLLMNSSQKAKKIKELTAAVSLNSQQTQNTKEIISKYRDEVGQYNVGIQKLKKQINIESKKLHNIKAKLPRLVKGNTVTESRCETGSQKRNKSHPFNTKLKKNESETAAEEECGLKMSAEELDKTYLQKMLKIIKNEEESILDETLDEPENLDLDAEENCTSEMEENLSAYNL